MNEEFSKEELLNLPYMNSNFSVEERVKDLLSRLTLKEKFKLSAGRQMWYTKPIRRLGIKSFAMHDGPHGVRVDNQGKTQSTYFPSAICRASTWNPKLSENFGIAIAQEVRDVGAQMLLAPGINIHRTPMCGRTFEYQTEDPYLNKKLVIPVVKGIQSQRIAACVKHFICNNQEINRFTINSEVSERALQEIYFPAFKAAVQEANAWSFMSSYNKINGIYGSEHHHLLREVLMKNWGFIGFVVSDWNATNLTSSTESCINAGLSLEMPMQQKYLPTKMKNAFDKGKFTEEILNDNIKRLLRVMFLTGLFDDESTLPQGSRNTKEHQNLAREIAEEGLVLLKNEGNLLPLNMEKLSKIAVIGPNANLQTYLGGGSSTNFPPYEITPLKGLQTKCEGKIEITDTPANADVALIFAGLKHIKGMDAEGFDKNTFNLPQEQIDLIEKTVDENSNTVVIIVAGSPVSMIEWMEKVPVVMYAWYGGMEAGNALSALIFGEVNPSGKLPITFPKYLSDSPAHASKRTYPGDENVYYEEGIFVGYRYFDSKNIESLFPFGYGLSYTTFVYENLRLDKEKISGDELVTITVDIINSGDCSGAEVVQLYIQDIVSSIERPIKELKGFKKIKLKPGEKSNVMFTIGKRDLSFFDENSRSWKTEEGEFNILIGSSSRDIRLKCKIEYIN